MRILSIDYGKKRTGLAVTDPLQIIANGLATVSTHELFTYIETYIQKEQVAPSIAGIVMQPGYAISYLPTRTAFPAKAAPLQNWARAIPWA